MKVLAFRGCEDLPVQPGPRRRAVATKAPLQTALECLALLSYVDAWRLMIAVMDRTTALQKSGAHKERVSSEGVDADAT